MTRKVRHMVVLDCRWRYRTTKNSSHCCGESPAHKKVKIQRNTSSGAKDRVCLLISVPACISKAEIQKCPPPSPAGAETGTPLVWSGSCGGARPFATANTQNFILSGSELF